MGINWTAVIITISICVTLVLMLRMGGKKE